MRSDRFRLSSLLFAALSLGLPYGHADAAPPAGAPFHLTRADLDRLRTESLPTLVLPVPGGGQATLRLAPFDLLRPDARITATSREGPRVIAKEARFLKGSVAGNDSAWAAFVLTPRGLRGHVWLGHELLGITPGPPARDGGWGHTVHRAPAALEDAARCGVNELSPTLRDQAGSRAPQLGSGSRPNVRLTCDMAVDCDYEFYQAAGREDQALDAVFAMYASVATIYERDLDTSVRLTYVNVWTTADDPYGAEGISALYEFTDWWQANRADVPRHLAHLLSGRRFSFGGVAFIDVLCNPGVGYGLTAASGSGIFTLAHEIGHNFGSYHTQSCFWQANGFAPAGALLDSCETAEGDCYTGPVGIEPEGGGTIMSYCSGRRLDFHPVTSAWMRERAESSCLPADGVQPPRNVAAAVEPNLVRLRWEPGGAPGVVRYDIYRSNASGDPAPDLIGSSATLEFVDARIRLKTYYKVRAVRDTDQSGFSQEALALPLPDQPPQVSAPSAWAGIEHVPLAISVSVSDPDFDPIEQLTASPLPDGAAFVVDADQRAGTFTWTPACFQAGEYTITFSAYSGAPGSATTSLTIEPTDCPPLVLAPPEVGAAEGQALEVEVTASDREADAIALFRADPLPEGATFTTSPDLTGGVLRWTPAFDQAGIYDITFEASSGKLGSATTRISISDVDRPPVLSFPSNASTIPGLRVTILVTASDLDGEAIQVLSASGLPAGATFSVGPGNEAATFEWIPQAGQVGSHVVSITASNASSTTALLRIDVGASADRPPTVDAPATASGAEGSPLSVTVTASDPDGDDLISLQSGPLPDGAIFQTDSPSHGALLWTPSYEQAGSHTVTLSAVSSSRASPTSAVELTGWAILMLAIANVDRAPSVTAPPTAGVPEGSLLELLVAASDPDGDPIEALTADLSSLPLGHDARFTPEAGSGRGQLEWTPGFDAAGDYEVEFVAVAHGLAGSARTRITVVNANRPPVADAGGPYSGFVWVPLAFDGSASSDPDGQPLSYRWQFGDGTGGVGIAAVHTYAQAGDYPVVLTVEDGALEASDPALASIAAALEAGAFTAPADRAIRLQSARPTWCVHVEPPAGSFSPVSIDVATVSLRYGVKEISAQDKTATVGDQDRDGLPDLSICFSKADLRTLFSDLPEGSTTVDAVVQGQLTGGGAFQASVRVQVVTGEVNTASVAPNPFTDGGTLTFLTRRAGPVTAQLFDLRGRLVGTLIESTSLPAGYHDVWIPRAARGKALPTGVYFFRLRTPEGTVTGRFTVMR